MLEYIASSFDADAVRKESRAAEKRADAASDAPDSPDKIQKVRAARGYASFLSAVAKLQSARAARRNAPTREPAAPTPEAKPNSNP